MVAWEAPWWQGIRAARAPFVCVMDADLQHPPELLEEMYLEAMETGSDLVVASRFCRGGDKGAFSRLRSALSRVSTRAAVLLFPTRLWHVSDPMSGCFIVRREAGGSRPPAPARLQDPAGDPRQDPRPARVRGPVRVRRAKRRPDEGLRARGAAVPAPARSPGAGPALRAVRAFHRGGRQWPRGEHVASGGVRRGDRDLLRAGGDPRHPGIDAVELLPHREVGVRRPRPQAQRRPAGGDVLRHEQCSRSRCACRSWSC